MNVYRLSWDHELLNRVLGVFHREVGKTLRSLARQRGLPGPHATGGVTVIQRFGSTLNLNVHFHSLFFDGVWMPDEGSPDGLRFAPLKVTDEAVAQCVRSTHAGVERLLVRLGLLELDSECQPVIGEGAGDESDELAQELPLFASVCQASVTGRIATGYRAGYKVRLLGGALLDDQVGWWREPAVRKGPRRTNFLDSADPGAL